MIKDFITFIFPDKHDGQSTSSQQESSDSKKKFNHLFQRAWLAKYPWLRYNSSTNAMYCQPCASVRMSNAMARDNKNFRTSTLMRHIRHFQHKEALIKLGQQSEMKKATDKAYIKSSEHIMKGMKAVYWLSKECLPLSKYPSMINFMQHVGATGSSEKGNASYDSRITASEYMDAIFCVITDNILEKLSKSQALSILIDESTDIKVQKKLVIYCKTVDVDLNESTIFLGNLEISEVSVTAEVIFNVLCTFLESRNINIKDIAGFGSDGASIMTGSKSGVATRIKELSPFLLAVHCMAHRLNLVTEAAAKNVPYVHEFQGVLTSLFYYFRTSTSRVLELKAIQDLLDLPEIKVKEVHEIRWLSFHKALDTVYRTYPALAKFFAGRTDSKAKDLHKKLVDYRFVSTIHMLMDIIPAFAQLSLIFQKQNLDISAVTPAVNDVLAVVQKAKESKSHYSKEFDDLKVKKTVKDKTVVSYKNTTLNCDKAKEMKEVRKDFCSELKQKITKRFPEDHTSIAGSLSCLAFKGLGFSFEDFGCKEIETLIQHFAVQRPMKSGEAVQPVIDSATTRVEWRLAKTVVKENNYPTGKISVIWKVLNDHHSGTFPNLLKLAKIALVTPLSTADCERGFSNQNLVFSKRRTSLSGENLNKLLTILTEGEPLEKFDFDACLRVYARQKQRRLLKK